jgi:hypothetical protein
MHDNQAVYVVSMRVSRIINLRNPLLLSLPWSEQRANKERTKSEQRAKEERTKCEYSPVFTYEKMQESGYAENA